MADWRKYSHLKDIPIQDIQREKPVILIGQDNIHLILPRQIRCGSDNLPVATKCKLGRSLHGPSPINVEKIFKAHTLHVCEKTEAFDDIEKLIKENFATESFGVLVTPDKMSKDNKRAMTIMDTTICYTGERYEIGLLWKNDHDILPESKYMALQRLKCMEKKCSLDKNFAEAYCQKINSYIEKGYVRKLKQEKILTDNPRLWYLPQFAVNNPNKPNKIRLVFDVAATSRGVSLNSKLLPGPDLLKSLFTILWKFRQRRFGFCGDVREMFHQIQIREQD
ncbi:uncharacterized protein [Leptinotarsa decemlineata]|uniref:uncharacterized protein n=1 Tax=Leptinotarsa decemlineata TaxID=7539 RepID=UPI003D304EFB